MNHFSEKNVLFLSEQDGHSEKYLKAQLVDFLEKQPNLTRAYLATVCYENNAEENSTVALCMHTHIKDESIFVRAIGDIFKNLFGSEETLDILFIDDEKEKRLRQVCCPFYTSDNYQIETPDFYLNSAEGYQFPDAIACFKRRKLSGPNENGYLLCDLSSPIDLPTGISEYPQTTQIILAARHQNYSLFPITSWPAYVHVAIPLNMNITNRFDLQAEDVKLLAWGELHKEPMGCGRGV